MALAEQGHQLLEAERPGPAVQALREALGLWRGPVLADMADEPFTQAERQRLEELRLAALEDRLAAELALGGHAAAVAELGELVGRFPFRERLHGLLMLALYRSGRQAEALQAFQAARRTLGEELGIDPSPWLRMLEADILRQAPALDWIPPTGHAGQPPPVEAAEPPVAAPVTAPPYPAGEGELVGRDGQLALLDRTLAGAAAGRGGWYWSLGSRASARPGWPRRPRDRPRRRTCGWCGGAATRGRARRRSGRGCRPYASCSPRWRRRARAILGPSAGELGQRCQS